VRDRKVESCAMLLMIWTNKLHTFQANDYFVAVNSRISGYRCNVFSQHHRDHNVLVYVMLKPSLAVKVSEMLYLLRTSE